MAVWQQSWKLCKAKCWGSIAQKVEVAAECWKGLDVSQWQFVANKPSDLTQQEMGLWCFYLPLCKVPGHWRHRGFTLGSSGYSSSFTKFSRQTSKGLTGQSTMILIIYIAHVCSMALLSWKVLAHLKFLISRIWKLFSNHFLSGGKNTFSWITTAMINAQYQLRFQDAPHPNTLNVDSATREILWNDPLLLLLSPNNLKSSIG